jgi:uncharacterized protein YlxW (UPF0749 family)
MILFSLGGSRARPRECFLGDEIVIRHWPKIGRKFSILLVGLTLGLLIAVTWQPSVKSSAGTVDSQDSRIQLSIQRLETEQQELKSEIAVLRQELADRQQAAAAHTDRLQVLKVELDRQQLLAGLTSVQGPGVVVTLDDSTVQIAPGADPHAYIIHEYDLRDIINLLWMAGSEAIAINDERMVSTSSIYCVGSTVMVNNTRLSPPYLIRAIGNPRIQQDYLRNTSHLQELKTKQRLYGLLFEVKEVANLTLPGYSGGFPVQYARPAE